MEWGPIIRIVLRYVAGFLVARGVIDAGSAAEGSFTDPGVLTSIETILGVVIAVASEVWYGKAKKSGGAT